VASGLHDSQNRSSSLVIVLYAIWIALIGAERIDFFNGAGPFILTPFLVLSPILIGVGLIDAIIRHKSIPLSISTENKTIQLAVMLVVFVCLVGVSVFFGQDHELGIRRYILLILNTCFVAIITALISQTRDYKRVLLFGGYLGISFSAFFSMIQVMNWLSGSQITVPFLSFDSHSIGVLVPRPSGVSLDPNRGGLLVVIYCIFVLFFSPPSRSRTFFLSLGVVLLILTLSKSAILTGLIALGVILFNSRIRSAIQLGKIRKSLIIPGIIFLAALCIADWERISSIIDYEEVIAERFSADEASSGGIHLSLISRGFDVFLDSFKNVLIGVGFGSAHAVLQDFYPGNKYANFHSTYVSVMVESGIFSLLIFLILHFLPIIKKTIFLPLILGIALFNIFYQLILEPAFWLVILLSWRDWSD